MLTRSCSVFLVILFGFVAADAQVCLSSWKTGSRQVREESLTLKLDRRHTSFEKAIRDSKGHSIGKLVVGAGYGAGDIIEWHVNLADTTGIDLLKPTNDPLQDAHGKEDWLGWFYLGSGDTSAWAKVVFPLTETRTVKIENFFCSMKLESYSRDPKRPDAFFDATFRVYFSNTKPAECNR